MRFCGLLATCALLGCGPRDRDDDGVTADVDCNDDDGNADFVSTFYADVDGDGFGDPATATEACAPANGYVADGTDCDDTAAQAHPGGSEICDGLDNDCDPTTTGSGAAFFGVDGLRSDLTSLFATGGPGDPAPITLDQDGTIYVCPGTWYVDLTLEADLDFRGEGGPDAVTLDGAGVGRGVYATDGLTVSAHGLTLSRFAGQDLLAYATYGVFGSALGCQGAAEVAGHDLILVGSGPSDPLGAGGILSAVNECSLTLTDSTVLGGDALIGGQLYVDHATVEVERTTFSNGAASLGGTAFIGSFYGAYFGFGGPSEFTCTSCDFVEGGPLSGGGAGSALFLYDDAQLVMNGGSFVSNQASGIPGGALIVSDVVSTSATPGAALTEVFFSGNVGRSEPTVIPYYPYYQYDEVVPSSVYVLPAAQGYDFEDSVQTLICDGDACE